LLYDIKGYKDIEGHLNYGLVFISGAMAGVANSSVLAPVEHMRIRMQVIDRFYFTTDEIFLLY